MPRYARKKTYTRRRRRPYRKGTLVAQPRSPIADSQVVHMKYCDLIQINSGAGTAASHLFSCVDIFDPDVTGTGHQPMGHDNWAAFYKFYRVIGAKIRVTFTPQGAGNTSSAIGAVSVKGTSTLDSSASTVIERAGTRWSNIGNNYGKDGVTLTKGFSAKKFFCIKDLRDTNTTRALFGASPNEAAFFHVSVFNPDGATDNSNVNATVEIQYAVMLTERVPLGQS